MSEKMLEIQDSFFL